MVKNTSAPEIKADPHNATLVIYRSTSFGYGLTINNYLNNTFIGQTKGDSYFITKVAPGTHYIISEYDRNDCMKLTLEAGYVYYIKQGVYPGPILAHAGLSHTDHFSFSKTLKRLTCFSLKHDSKIPVMSEAKYKKTLKEFEKKSTEKQFKSRKLFFCAAY